MLSTLHRLGPKAHALIASGCMALSIFLVFAHLQSITFMNDVSVPLLGTLPALERKLQTLEDQLELTTLHAATRIGSQEEKISMYALPNETNMSRLIATFEVVRDVLEREGLLSSMSELTIGEPIEHSDGTRSQDLSTRLSLHEDGLHSLMLLVRLSGLLTVADALTEEETALLIDTIEQENPAGIIALEQFLSADLLRYAHDAKTYEQQLKKSFSSTMVLNTIDTVLRTSLLREAKYLLQGDIGQALDTYKLWPLQLLSLEEVSLLPGASSGWFRTDIRLSAWSQES